MSPLKLIAYLGARFSHSNNYTIDNEVFKNEYKNYEAEKAFIGIQYDRINTNQPDVPTCIQLKSSLLIGRDKYTDMKLLLSPWVKLQPYDKLKTEIDSFLPQYEEYEGGIRSTLRNNAEMTIKRALHAKDITPDTEEAERIVENGLFAEISFGGDGSGGHAIYNTSSALEGDSSHMIVSGYVLTKLKLNSCENGDEPDEIIFEEKTPNSSEAERCLAIIPQQENYETMSKFLKELESEKIDLESNAMIIDYPDIGEIKVNFKCTMSQLDMKAQCIGNGLTGCFCTMCTVSAKNAKVPKKIQEGFPMDRSILSLSQLFEELEKEENNPDVLLSKPGESYEKGRTGLKRKPQLKTDDTLKNFPVTHSYINSLNFFEQLTYHVNAKVYVWGRGKSAGEVGKGKISDAKNEFRKKAKEGPMHMRLDMPDSSGTGAGNTDTGNTARRFFEFKNRIHFVDLFNGTPEEKEAIATLHKNFSVILRLYSSKKHKIDVDYLEELCTETNLLLVTTFPWATQPPSVHKLLAHSAQRIRLNDGYGMGNFSEEGLETLHKMIRRFRELLARKNNLFLNLFDVWRVLMVRSDPIIRNKKRKLYCSVCKGEGHTKRSCKMRDELTKQGCLNEYDDLFNNLLIE